MYVAIFKKHSEPNVSMTNKMTLALDSSNLQYYLETTMYNDNVQYYLWQCTVMRYLSQYLQ